MTKLVAAFAFLALNFYTYYYMATDERIPPHLPFADFPLQVGDWECRERENPTPDVLENLGATDWLICSYLRREPPAMIGIYVGYHETQVRREGGGSRENSIHPPEHCLPGAGWDVIDSRVVPLDIPGLPTGTAQPEAKRFVIAKGNERQLVYFWYQTRGRVIARNHEVILYRFWDRASAGRSDGALVRMTVPLVRGDEERAEQSFREFAAQLVPLLPQYVPN